MANASNYQRSHWYKKLKQFNEGDEFCNLCGVIRFSKTKNKTIDNRNKIKLIVDRIDNSNDHRIRNNTIEDFQLLCRKCNYEKNPRKINNPILQQSPIPGDKTNRFSPSSRPASREKIDRGLYEPAFNRNLTTRLMDFEHLCYVEIEMGGSELSEGGSIVTCKRYFISKIKTQVNPKGTYQTFDFSCDSQYCNGTHVCLAGQKPKTLLALEKQKLINSWTETYDNHRKDWKTNSSTFLMAFMELPEYIETHGQLLNHKFS